MAKRKRPTKRETVKLMSIAESFGEFASMCHASRFSEALYRHVSDMTDAMGWKPRRVK